jgi:PAS domain S-box-containing protein
MLDKFFHDVFDNNFGGIFIIDGAYRIKHMNKAAQRITGFSEEEAIGKFCYEILRSKSCKDSCPLKTKSKTTQPKEFVTDILSKSNRKKYIKVKVVQTHGVWVEIFTDITREVELEKYVKDRFIFEDIITNDKALLDILKEFPKIAISNAPVLFEGESGVGKEVYANALQALSQRRDAPYVKINCAALPDTLLESELFGYKKGAFTDAKRDKPGHFAMADRGTIFLDEIGEIPLTLQAKLLRAVETGEVIPLGGIKSEKVDVRLITATNKDLQSLVKNGKFREDLYYRLNLVTIRIPPLRERKHDIPLFIDFFINQMNAINEKHIIGVADPVMKLLMNHHFSGNVRELKNILEHAFIFCRSGVIQAQHLPRYIRENSRRIQTKDLIQTEMVKEIMAALKQAHWNHQKAAEILNMNRTTLWRKMKKFNII